MNTVQLKLAALLVALLVLPSCGGGGGGGNNQNPDPGPGTMITPPGSDDTNDNEGQPANHVDEADTVASAKVIAPGATTAGYFDEPGDVDYLRLPLSGLNEAQLELKVPEGTEITVLDDNGNVLVTTIARQGQVFGYGGSGKQALSVRYPSFAQAACVLAGPAAPATCTLAVLGTGAVTIGLKSATATKLAVGVGGVVGAWVLGTKVIPAAIDIVKKLDLNIKVTTSNETKHNLSKYRECRLRGRNEPCTLEFEHVRTVAIGAYSGNNPIVAVEQDRTLKWTAGNCKPKGGRFETIIRHRPIVAGQPVPGVEWESETITVDVGDLPDCDDNSGSGDGSGSGSGSGNCDTLGTNFDPFSASIQETCRLLSDLRHCIEVENDPQLRALLNVIEDTYGVVCGQMASAVTSRGQKK
ncbi:hypothetical protein F4212_02740 [Candidatus Poribacteria bacterium]|nr:hypothetical protein [Candidatus Poribacteria bacterium]